jgi:hypothetical protein
MLNCILLKSHSAECKFGQFHSDKCHFSECHSGECQCAECKFAKFHCDEWGILLNVIPVNVNLTLFPYTFLPNFKHTPYLT